MQYKNEVPVISSGIIGEEESCRMNNSAMEVNKSTVSEISTKNNIHIKYKPDFILLQIY